MPALPLHEAGKYVAAAYIVLFALILIYVAVMAAKLGRIERQQAELLDLAQRRADPRGDVEPLSELEVDEPVRR